MKNSDEAIDKVLRGLGNAEAPAGMDQRILRRMEERATAPAEDGWRGEFRRKRVFVLCGIAPVATACLVLVLCFGRQRTDDHATKTIPDRHTSHAAVAATVADAPAIANAKPAPRRYVRHDERQALALQPPKEASFPAPPMPLTAQEKLLLKLARRGDPEELAMLTHIDSATQTDAEMADFANFFEQPSRFEQQDKGDHNETQ